VRTGASGVSALSARVAATLGAGAGGFGGRGNTITSSEGVQQAPWRGGSSFSRAAASRESGLRRTAQRVDAGASRRRRGAPPPPPPSYAREDGPISPEAWARADDMQRVAAVEELEARRRPRRAERFERELRGGGRGGRSVGSGRGFTQSMRRPRKVQPPAHHGVRSRNAAQLRAGRSSRRAGGSQEVQHSQSLRRARRGGDGGGGGRRLRAREDYGIPSRRRGSSSSVRRATDRIAHEMGGYSAQHFSDGESYGEAPRGGGRGERRRERSLSFGEERDAPRGGGRRDGEWVDREEGVAIGSGGESDERLRDRSELKSRYNIPPIRLHEETLL
jgi:hypothetical protein